MEQWIQRNANKLMLAFGVLILLNCVEIIRQGGKELPRIQELEAKTEDLENRLKNIYLWRLKVIKNEKKQKIQYQNHEHEYPTGKPFVMLEKVE